ncbi:conjugal transfer protein [Streptomyces luteireticuli]|uniref:conjugal transfer protein n=1 Tax=Streptomyces luteireticuli TaxID=173858 RepID=UPI0035582DBE
MVVWGVIGLAAATGVRTWVVPPAQKQAAPKADRQAEARQDEVPAEAAQQVAERFARSYLTWNGQAKEAREKELAVDLPKGADAKAGWNGEGSQLVAQTIAGTVTQTGGKRARVAVDVRVSVTTGSGSKQQTVSGWRGLEVPVAEAGGRVIVAGQPALVGMPSAVDYTAPKDPEPDAGFSGSTRSVVNAFLSAWAAGTEGQAAAPGAVIAPLGGGIALEALDSWSADGGSGDKRTGTAVARWKLAGGVIQQTYRITLTEVRTNSATRWQVWAVTAR